VLEVNFGFQVTQIAGMQVNNTNDEKKEQEEGDKNADGDKKEAEKQQ
jgi:hypothetical protein